MITPSPWRNDGNVDNEEEDDAVSCSTGASTVIVSNVDHRMQKKRKVSVQRRPVVSSLVVGSPHKSLAGGWFPGFPSRKRVPIDGGKKSFLP